MKRLFCCIVFLTMLGTAVSCSSQKWGSGRVYLNYALNGDKTGYEVTGSNVTDQSALDRWEMVDVVIPSTYKGLPVVGIRPFAFQNSAIMKSISIPESIRVIPYSAFLNCTGLETVWIPKSVERMYGGSFLRCSSLRAVTVDPENPYFCSVDGNVYTKDMQTLVFYAPGNASSEFAIPDGVTAVAKDALRWCGALEQITVPSTVTDLPHDGIAHCSRLRGVTVDGENPKYRSVDGNLYSKDGAVFLRFYQWDRDIDLVIPDGVTEIADYAASGCENLISVAIPDTVQSIGSFAMDGTGLTRVRIPAAVSCIGEDAFAGCESLSEVVFDKTAEWTVVPQSGKFTLTEHIKTAESAEENAAYLVEMYADCVWHRTEE